MKTNKKFGMLSAAVLLALVSSISPWGGGVARCRLYDHGQRGRNNDQWDAGDWEG